MLSGNFLQFRGANKSLQRSQAYQKYLNHLLLAEINNKKKNIKVLANELSSVKSNLLRISNFSDFNHVCNIIISHNKKFVLKCRYTHEKKLRDLIPGCEVNPTRFSHDPNKVIFNFSSYALTEYEKSLFCKSLRFSIPPKTTVNTSIFEREFYVFKIKFPCKVIVNFSMILAV